MAAVLADRIGLARVRTEAGERLAAELAAARHLGAVELRPRAMGGSAVLIARRLVAARPWRHAVLDVAWEAALRDSLDALFRRARSPAAGPVPDDAPAVVFADEGELLACLALDLARGTASGRWWWALLLRDLPSPAAATLPALLATRPRAVPAALGHLTHWGHAATVLAVVSPRAAVAVLREVAGAWGLAAVWDVGAWGQSDSDGGPPGQPPPDELPGRPAPSTPAAPASREESTSAPIAPPWGRWVPPSLAGSLGRERALLLGVALALQRAPAAVRTADFGVAARAWWRDQGRPGPRDRSPDDGRAEAAPPAGRAAARSAEIASASTSEPSTAVAPAVTARPGQEEPAEPRRAALRPPAAEHRVHAGVATAPEPSVEPRARPALPDPIRTRLAGAFYLINLMRSLDLPARFEADWDLASRLGSWGTLEALARALLDPAGDDLVDDPIWPALAALDGREPGARLGATLSGPGGVRLPRHRRRRAPRRARRGPYLRDLDPRLLRWLALALPGVRRRLGAALGPADPGRVLLRVPGRVHVSATHVDVVMPLSAVSLPVRRAGLDADPGWAPEFGRVVQFHYE